MLEHALQLALAGWPIFPCEPHGKKPLTSDGFKSATTSEHTIRKWWERWPEANIGYPAVSTVVIDIDGPEGEDALRDLQEQHGALPETLTARTGKGRHLYFAKNGAAVRPSAGKLGPGLDIRTEGSYVIIPPSIHPSGARYEWINPNTKPAPLPPWLAKLLAEPERKADPQRSAGKIPEGERHRHLLTLAGQLRAKRYDEPTIVAALLAENASRCDPPKLEGEIRELAADICRRYAPGTKPNGKTPQTVPGVMASEVRPEKVRWLWSQHIARGKLTLCEGDPDEGKSSVAFDLVARVTRGFPMPDGSPGIAAAGAVIVSLEDGAADTIVPRLMAAGADLAKIRIVQTITGPDGLERTPTLPCDLGAIEAAIKDVGAAILVIDPFVATLAGDTNSFRDQDIRRVLAPVAALADKTGTAVIAVRHLNKGNNPNPKYRGGGSIGIIGAARAAFLFGQNPDDETTKIMVAVKTNLCPKPPAMKYRLSPGEVMIEGEPTTTVKVAWEGETAHTARSILAEPDTQEESNAIADAKGFLDEFLTAGAKDAKEVKHEARTAGIAERTLIRSRYIMGIKAKKVGIGAGQHWEWELPPKDATKSATKDANTSNLAFFEQNTETKPFNSNGSPKDAKVTDMASFEGGDGILRSSPDETEV